MIIYDTDIFTLMQRAEARSIPRLVERVSRLQLQDIKITIISFEEQTRGWLAYIAKAKTLEAMITAYGRLQMLLADYAEIGVLPFDQEAAFHFDRLRKMKTRVGTMDLKIAAIALANSATIITRNLNDFGKLPGVKAEDWTKDQTE
jgi:tRNA(fMet)-specific endonuclease VapC